jgi:hypothetical protein
VGVIQLTCQVPLPSRPFSTILPHRRRLAPECFAGRRKRGAVTIQAFTTTEPKNLIEHTGRIVGSYKGRMWVVPKGVSPGSGPEWRAFFFAASRYLEAQVVKDRLSATALPAARRSKSSAGSLLDRVLLTRGGLRCAALPGCGGVAVLVTGAPTKIQPLASYLLSCPSTFCSSASLWEVLSHL